MGTKSIKVSLSLSGIDETINEISSYRQDILRKTDLLRTKLSQRIAILAQNSFDGAIMDDIINGAKRVADVSVSVFDNSTISVIVASGQDAIWVEFGAGVFNNGSSGSSPHPKGQELGYIIGGYGKGMGKKSTWGFYEDGQLVLTHGTPSVMPMYSATKTVFDNIYSIAREVFS